MNRFAKSVAVQVTLIWISVIAAGFMIASFKTSASAIPDRRQGLIEARKNYPALINQTQAGDLLNRFAWQFKDEGFGLLRKDGGNNCPLPNSDIKISCDWIVHRPSGLGCDVLVSGPDPDAPGPSTPTWCGGDPFDVSKFVSPVDPGFRPPPVDPPQPPVDLSLGPRVTELENRLTAANRRIDVLMSRVEELESRPASGGINEDQVNLLISAAVQNLVVTGGTGRTLSHSHSINLQVQRR